MNTFSSILALLFLSLPVLGAQEGVITPYTDALHKMLQNWSSRKPHSINQSENPIQLKCYSTASDEMYVGVEQHMVIHAPFSAVEKVLDDVDHYADIFPGFVQINITEKNEKRWLIFWEQKSPIFLVPNIRYQMIYYPTHTPTRSSYRYLLKNSNRLTASDGLIVIEKKDDNTTDYTEFDFFNADYGIAKSLAPSRVWRESVEGIYLSDAGIKFRAENPKLTGPEIQKTSRELLGRFSVEEAVKSKSVFFTNSP